MTTYYVLEITTVNGTTAKAVWEHTSLDAAYAQYHQVMASAYANADCTYALCMIINDLGFSEVMSRKPTPQPEE